MTIYTLFDASGSSRELGRQHGEQCQEPIRGYLEFLRQSLALPAEQLSQRAMAFEPLFQKHCPELLEEVRGLAEGAGLPFAAALALQLRGELGAALPQKGDSPLRKQPGWAERSGEGDSPLFGATPDGACTTFVLGPSATADGQVLIGQTSDTPAEIEQYAYGLRLKPEGRPAILMWTFGGMLGYHGLNAHGIAHFANALGGGPKWNFALSHYPLKRLLLEQRSLADVLDLMRRVPVCSNGNYVLCDGTGRIVDVELTSEGPFVLKPPAEGFLAHSNHYLCQAHACDANFARSLPDSFPRLDRVRELIREKLGRITLADMQAVLSDHAGHPTSICRHPHSGLDDPVLPASGKTVAAIVAQPQSGRMTIAKGNPCENPFVEWTLA